MYLLWLLLLLLTGCQHDGPPPAPKILTVMPETIKNSLYYSGTIAPKSEIALTAPNDGVIIKLDAHYGQKVSKGAPIFTIKSDQLQQQYNEALTEYLKAKDNWTINDAKFQGTRQLWEAGLIARNNWLAEQSALGNTRITLMQALQKLDNILNKFNYPEDKNLVDLTLSDFAGVKAALANLHNTLTIYAPTDGIVLSPPKNNDNNAELAAGSSIKAGQSLGIIGDVDGFKISINIPEVDVGKIIAHMPAHVTSIANPDINLHGEIISINAEAKTGNTSPLPSFTAIIEVSRIAPALQDKLKIGMSANVELVITDEERILLPASAIHETSGSYSVTLTDLAGNIQETGITPGATIDGRVIIVAGIKPGDKVLCQH